MKTNKLEQKIDQLIGNCKNKDELNAKVIAENEMLKLRMKEFE